MFVKNEQNITFLFLSKMARFYLLIRNDKSEQNMTRVTKPCIRFGGYTRYIASIGFSNDDETNVHLPVRIHTHTHTHARTHAHTFLRGCSGC